MYLEGGVTIILCILSPIGSVSTYGYYTKYLLLTFIWRNECPLLLPYVLLFSLALQILITLFKHDDYQYAFCFLIYNSFACCVFINKSTVCFFSLSDPFAKTCCRVAYELSRQTLKHKSYRRIKCTVNVLACKN